ncbi:MAG: phosphotransferase family protein [Bacillota bacterium]
MQERLAAYLGGPVEGFRVISPGWETEVYAFDHAGAPLVMRLYQGRNVQGRAENEYRMMRYLGQRGYPVPRVDRYEPDPAPSGGPFLLMERVEGRPLAHLFREQPHEQVIGRLCELQTRLHAMDWREFLGPDRVWPDLDAARSMFEIDRMAGMLREMGLLEPLQPLVDWLAERGRGVRLRLAPLHGDFHFENVLVRPDGSAAVIDWGITGLGDPRCDLAYAYILLTTEGNGRVGEQYRQIYESMAGPVEDFDFFEAWALGWRLSITLIVLVRGSAAIGLRPGLEELMRQHLGYLRHVAALLSDRTGLRLPGVEALLAD